MSASVLCLFAGRVHGQSTQPISGDRVRYDAQCLTIDGVDKFIYSGAFHYFRCPKSLWRDRFQKIKEAGFNTVETYTPWNWHERDLPGSTEDFSKVTRLQDFDDWLTMAEAFGFYTIIRPGPYICAEWDNGGFPLWLTALKTPKVPLHKQGWLRSDDPTFLAWTRHWYAAICPIIAKHQVTRKPPGSPGVILVQIENEYDVARYPDSVKEAQLKALAAFAREDGINVPLITCWTRPIRGTTDSDLKQIFDCCNFYPRWNVKKELVPQIEKLRREQPNAPLATTELQGGWLSVVGGKLSERQDGITGAQIQNLTLLAWQLGQTLTNYYMLVGGTNFDDWGGRNITTTYDYNAPIRENGGVGERYWRVWALGQMIREHGARLVRSTLVPIDSKASDPDVDIAERRAADGSRYFFVRTDERQGPRKGTATVIERGGESITFDYQLEPFGSAVLYLPPGERNPLHGEWLPKSPPPMIRPRDLPSPIVIDRAERFADPTPSRWTPLAPGDSIEKHGVFNSHDVYYRLRFDPESAPRDITVSVNPGDAVIAHADSTPVPPVVSKDRRRLTFVAPSGTSQLTMLYENLGHRNGPKDMENGGNYGIWSVTGGGDKAELEFAAGGSNERDGNYGEALSQNAAHSGGEHVSMGGSSSKSATPDALLTWYRMHFTLPAPKPGIWVPWHLHIEAEGNGFIYLNGHSLGRYWQVGPQHDFYIPETWLHWTDDKPNTIALNLRPVDAPVSVTSAQIVPDASFAEYR